jgi:carbamoyl-phosphate synthase small subunit
VPGPPLKPGAQGRQPPAPLLPGCLLLEDGTYFEGNGAGASATTTGEVVFTTGMVGYPESLTDPSYRGQILTFTYPLLGNYGVGDPRRRDAFGLPVSFESGSIQVRAAVLQSLTPPHHWASALSLPEWAARAGVPILTGIDTRRLTAHLRTRGVLRGLVHVGAPLPSRDDLARALRRAPRYEEEDLVSQVTPRQAQVLASGRRGAPLVAVVDCGCKASILRSLLGRGLDVLRLPAREAVPERFHGRRVLGLLVGNGPGDPATLQGVVEAVREVRRRDLPTLGICLGQQLLGQAAGGTTYKMKFGHRGQNKPVLFPDGRAYILSENHGYAVDPKSLKGTGLRPWAVDPDDGTLEGLRDPKGRVLSLQGHPEGGPGPREAGFVFDLFAQKVRRAA